MTSLTEAQQKAVIALGDKVTVPQLHREFLRRGQYVRQEVIRRFLARQGITPASGRREPLRGVDVAMQLEELGSVRAVAERFGCSQWAVRLALKRQRTSS